MWEIRWINDLTLMVSTCGIFNKRDFGFILFSESNDDVPLSLDPSDSAIQK